MLHQYDHRQTRGSRRQLAPGLPFLRPGLRHFRHSLHHRLRKIYRHLYIVLRGEGRPDHQHVIHIGPALRALVQMGLDGNHFFTGQLAVHKGVQQGGVFMDIHFTAPFLFC